MPKELICKLIKSSLADKRSKDYITFPLHEKCIRRVSEILKTNLTGYSCKVHSNGIRHVHNEHPNDVRYLCFIPDILKNFNKIRKENLKDAQTGMNYVAFEFEKKFNDDIVKLVKVRVLRDKTIDLKTMFVKDKV